MKKLVVAFSTLTLFFTGAGCIKDSGCRNQTIQSETGAMATYAAANGMTPITHSSGVVYQVTVAGTGPNATQTDNVKVNYTGKFMDGAVFETSTTPVTFRVDGTIPGWQVALQQLREGGKIRVIIPSSLAYGCEGRGSIPSSAILYFDIELLDIL